jgi:hypothetical protein
MKSNLTYHIILMTFFGTLGSILIGFVFYNTNIFSTTRPVFQFVASGLSGAFFFSLIEYKGVREQIYGMIIILLLQVIIFTGRNLSIANLIRDIFYLGGIFLSIKLYFQFLKHYPELKYYQRCFGLVLFYCIINTLFMGIVFYLNTSSGLPPRSFIYFVAKNSVLIGLGLGLGIDFYLQKQKLIFDLLNINTE